MAPVTAAVANRWDVVGFRLTPAAPDTGPFPGRGFLETWWDHRAMPDDELLLVAGEDGLLPLMRRGELVSFVGEPDLTDYHSPRGGDLAEVAAALAAFAEPGWRFDLDSLPDPAAHELAAVLTGAGLPATVTRHQTAAVLDLPPDHATYLGSLDKKQRHELRRKRRRFAAELGTPRLTRRHGAGAVAEFSAMHRLATGEKGSFMTPAMERFFVGLHDRAGGVVDFLAGDDGSAVAAAFGFEDATGYYLYNSAFDPTASSSSPGVVLVDLLVEQAIAGGRSTLDFLKGDEDYKFRMGARERPLFRLTGDFGGVR